VLSWLHVPTDDFAPAVAAGIDLGVSSVAYLDAVLAGVRATGRTARLHLMIDTGLSRGGAPAAQWPDLVYAAAKAAAEGAVEVVGVFSHLSHGDTPGHPTLDLQAERLAAAWQTARDRGLRPLRHLANS